MSEDRVTDLEVKLAFQEHTLHQLDEVIQKLHARIEQLENRVNELQEEQLASLQPLDNPKPPHW